MASRTLAPAALAGASILAIQRDDQYLTTVTAGESLREGDVLYLIGDDSDVMLARRRIREGM